MTTLERAGFRVELGRHITERHRFFAGGDAARAHDLLSMLARPDIAAVFCVRGGYGSQRLLPQIVRGLAAPKALVGYSDITALHHLVQREGWVSFHGPMAPYRSTTSPPAVDPVELLMQMLTGAFSGGPLPLASSESIRILQPGRAKGRLVGGNLSLVTALLGTPYEIDTRGAILFLEEVGEAPYRIDRMLSSLHLAGKFADAAGAVLGDFTHCDPPSSGPATTVSEVLEAVPAYVRGPVLAGFPAGHGRYNVPLPLGLEVILDTDAGTIILPRSAVEGRGSRRLA